jgi:cytochrome c oxidase assembly factor CtaG
MNDLWSIATQWNLDPWVGLPLIATAILYGIGLARLWSHAGTDRGVRIWQALCFASGWLALLLALISPLYRLGEGLFLAHMVEHEIVMLVAAPLIVVARPLGTILWALPTTWRPRFGAMTRRARVTTAWRLISNPWMATAVHGLTLWIWHAPALYERALGNLWIHRLQHVSFLVTALLFWWALTNPRVRLSGYGVAVGCLFVTTLHSGFLGALLTVSRAPWYGAQAEFAALCGLTALEDQQLAGLIMWIPAGLIYTGAALAFAGLWISAARPGRFHAPMAN